MIDVLIAEDLLEIAELVMLAARRTGIPSKKIHHCFTVSEVEQRLKFMDNLKVLVTDWNIPDPNKKNRSGEAEGGQIIKLVRQKFPDVFIIAMTGNPNNYELISTFRPNNILSKPFDIQELISTITMFREKIEGVTKI